MITAIVRRDLPAGTVTFLFTDVEGSTKLLHELGAEAYADKLAEHRLVVRQVCTARGGVEVDTQGDAFFLAFPTAQGGLEAARAITEELASGPITLRIGLHTGTPLLTEEGYVGEDVHFAARVAASAHGGQIVLSQATRALFDDGHPLLELGEHRLKDIPEPVPIFQLGEAQFPPLKTISNTNLPRPASSFVGRERELQEVLARIEGGARLVTLTGPGGSGKTRLALEAAASLVPEYKAGVFWVGLASLRDPGLVTQTIARTLGAKDGLGQHVGEREMLLLLDNLEQVIEASPELLGLLQECPNLTLLVTSRELLRVQGEVEYQVPPLAEAEAVSLFCERAQSAASEEIVALCARLDSLPLAVELAAARTKALSPAQILERVSQRLDLLKGGRDADPRQQTLRATIEWSYDLLSEEEQQLFRRMSIFAGGCRLEAAEEVAGADLETLQSLVEKSLLRFTNERYWMLETIRDYAAEELERSGDAKRLQRRHMEHFLIFAERKEPLLRGADEAVAVGRLRVETPNLRAALGEALAIGDVEAGLRLVAALHPFWYLAGYVEEGREWAERALGPGGTPEQREKALRAAGEFALMQGARAEAKRHLEEAKEICVALRDPGRLVAVHTLLGHLAITEEDYTLALDAYDRALAFEDEATQKTIVWQSRASALNNLGFALLHLGRLEEAEARLKEAVEAGKKEQTAFVQNAALNNLARVALARRDADALRQSLTESIHRLGDTADLLILEEAFELLARLFCFERRPDAAARAAGAAARLRELHGVDPHFAVVPDEEMLAKARMEIGETWDAQIAQGQAAVDVDPLEYARQCLGLPESLATDGVR